VNEPPSIRYADGSRNLHEPFPFEVSSPLRGPEKCATLISSNPDLLTGLKVPINLIYWRLFSAHLPCPQIGTSRHWIRSSFFFASSPILSRRRSPLELISLFFDLSSFVLFFFFEHLNSSFPFFQFARHQSFYP